MGFDMYLNFPQKNGPEDDIISTKSLSTSLPFYRILDYYNPFVSTSSNKSVTRCSISSRIART
jgi:hypothetical protein